MTSGLQAVWACAKHTIEASVTNVSCLPRAEDGNSGHQGLEVGHPIRRTYGSRGRRHLVFPVGLYRRCSYEGTYPELDETPFTYSR